MSMAQIIAHPKTFLTNNALWPSGMLNQEAEGRPSVFKTGTNDEGAHVIPIQLQRKAGVECRRQGTPLACLEIAPNPSPFSTLAYYLPWRPNSTLSMVLGDKADFFITDTMNGCTFGVGHGGNPRVAHVNYNTFNEFEEREEGRPIDTPFMDREVARVTGRRGQMGVLRKADYTTDNFPNVTVIGVRKNNLSLIHISEPTRPSP